MSESTVNLPADQRGAYRFWVHKIYLSRQPRRALHQCARGGTRRGQGCCGHPCGLHARFSVCRPRLIRPWSWSHPAWPGPTNRTSSFSYAAAQKPKPHSRRQRPGPRPGGREGTAHRTTAFFPLFAEKAGRRPGHRRGGEGKSSGVRSRNASASYPRLAPPLVLASATLRSIHPVDRNGGAEVGNEYT